MKPRFLFLVSVLAAGSAVAPAGAQILIDETFDGYTGTAQMQANWGTAGLGTLSTTSGNPGNSMAHPGGADNIWAGSLSVAPDATHILVLSGDLYDDGTSSNKRLTIGLRNASASPLFEMGEYNSPAGMYLVRVGGMYGQTGAWTPFSPSLVSQPRWNHFVATFSTTSLIVSLDLGDDGTVDYTQTFTGSPSASVFNQLRLGGPSGLSSAGGGGNFDNIRLELVAVPEPSGAVLGLLGALGLLLRRVRRQQ